jgi:CBS domain-containing protein
MDDVFVAQLMSTELKTVAPGTLVEDAAAVMLDNQISSVLVVESGQIRGILTSTDFVRIVSKSQPKAETPVERYMTADVSTATAQDSVQSVADVMVEHGIHHIPVVDDDDEELIGIITSSDMTGYLSTQP